MAGAGASGDAGAPATTPVAVEIDREGTHFLDYGKLRITFDHDVNASALQVELAPRSPALLVAKELAEVDARTVDVTLGYYHLPLDYALTVTGELADGAPFEASATLPGLGNGARVAFLSKRGGNGNFTSWAGAAAGATPLEIADGVCQAEADSAGLRGTFRAFLSVFGTADAGCRALGLSGTLAEHCGEASTPSDDAPILATNGLPIVAGTNGILLDAWATPIPFYADGSPAMPDYVWTGSVAGAKGYENDDCSGFTSTTGKGLASLYVAQRLLSYDFGRDCTINGNLMCIQTSGSFFGPSTLHEAYGKRAFVSKGQLYGNMSYGDATGRAAADALCQDEAEAASFANAGAFHAYLATAEADALCHVLGLSGQVSNKCGLSTLPDTDPWRRVDDYPIGTAAELAASKLRAPLSLAADGTPMNDERPRTGTDQDGAASWNCGDWTATSAYSLSGDPRDIGRGWSSHWTTDCDQEQTSVFCFEN